MQNKCDVRCHPFHLKVHSLKQHHAVPLQAAYTQDLTSSFSEFLGRLIPPQMSIA